MCIRVLSSSDNTYLDWVQLQQKVSVDFMEKISKLLFWIQTLTDFSCDLSQY